MFACLCFDCIKTEHVTSDLPYLTLEKHTHTIFWPQIQTNVNKVCQPANTWQNHMVSTLYYLLQLHVLTGYFPRPKWHLEMIFQIVGISVFDK